ncbi:MAG: hypothetical protein JXL97_18155 [Bacteroidales bacterium]|nr:hypothetical protein [Bacteroidales bacterium]
MAKTNKSYDNIKSLNDLKRQRQIIETKLRIRKHLLNKHIRDLDEDFSGDYVFRQSLKSLKMDNPIYSFIPGFIKGVKPGKKVLVPLFSGIGSAIAAFLLMKDNSSKKKRVE